jgi:hypothetical protein
MQRPAAQWANHFGERVTIGFSVLCDFTWSFKVRSVAKEAAVPLVEPGWRSYCY